MKNGEIIYRKGIPKATVLETVSRYFEAGYSQIALEIDDRLYANFDAGGEYGWHPFEYVPSGDFSGIDFKEALKILICSGQPMEKEML